MIKRWMRPTTLGAIVACVMTAAWMPASAAEAVAPPAAAVAAITAEAEATVKAFNAGNAKALAAMFIADGEIVDENGTVTTGRTEIEALFCRFFQRFP